MIHSPLRTKNWHPLAASIALLFLIPPNLAAEEADSFEEALKLSKEEELPLLVIFTGSDWSKLSITFEQEILTHQVFEKWAESKVAWTLVDLPRVGLDAEERRKRRELMKKLGVETFPMAVFLNAQEQPLGTLTHDPEGPSSWTKRADAILAGKPEASDTAASTEYLPEEVRKSLEDETLTEVQRSIAYYNKALELEKAEPEISLKSKDRFELLSDLYHKAADSAPLDRKDLIFAARHKLGLLHHRKGQSQVPKSQKENMTMARQEGTDQVKLLLMAKRSFEAALGLYKEAAPLKPGDEDFSENLTLVYRNLARVQAYLDYYQAYQLAIQNTATSLNQEKRFLESLKRDVSTRLEVNRMDIEASVTAIQDLIVKAEVIEDTPTILPGEGLKDYRLAMEDIALAPSPHRERELRKSTRHIQDALDHLFDPRQPRPPQEGGT
jgi:tetratricopeptide (TPR) repeat protein